MNNIQPEDKPRLPKKVLPEDYGEQIRIKVLGITLIECKKVTGNVIILVSVVLVLSIVLAWVLGSKL